MDASIERYPDLAGRTIFVSGGASGIGAAIVRAFVAQGSRVAFVDVDDSAGRAIATGLGDAARFFRCDVRDIPALQRAIEDASQALGRIGVLINNAARDDRHALDDTTVALWDEAMAVNLRHHFFAAQAVAPSMAAAGGGSIINLGSVSWMRGRPRLAGYVSAKAAIFGLTRSLARELGGKGIRVNSVVPGAVDTARQRALWVDAAQEKALLEQQCLKLRVTEHDVARATLFLASNASRAITGQSIVVDAGLAQTSVIA
jgi:NAD(P)-dependent dehydrogenase (short-subunit alcohol dehydrogenase family)